jgi:hypothetical protein
MDGIIRVMTVVSHNLHISRRSCPIAPACAYRAARHRFLPAFAPSIHRNDRGTLACLGEAR